jgi:hypothetical protein
MSARYRTLAAHVRRLPDDDLNDLLVELPRARFAALATAALTSPMIPTGLKLRLASAGPGGGWRVLGGRPARPLGAVTRGRLDGRVGWRAWTRRGELVAIGGLSWWRRRADAAGALAWVSPASGARCLALAGYVRALGDLELNDLLVELPVERFDALLDAAFPPKSKGVAA